MIDALGFILSLISIPALVKLDEANTRYKSRAADNQPTGYTLRPSRPYNLVHQMSVYEKIVNLKLSPEKYGNAPFVWHRGYNRVIEENVSGYDLTYKIDENGNVTNEKTTAKDRWHIAFHYFINKYPQYRWVYFVEEDMLKGDGSSYDKYFQTICIRDFTLDAVKEPDENTKG